jgi:hypothetical protein
VTVPAFVASGVEASGVGDITPALPAGWAAGHLFLLAVETANQAVSAPSGWTETTNSPQSTGTAGGTSATRLHVFQRIAQSGDTAPTVADSGDHQIAWITAFSGIDATTPVLHSAGSVLSSAGQTGTATGFTTTVADCLIVMIGTHAEDLNDDAACVVANANLTSVTVRKTFNSTAGNGGCLVVATGIRASAGAIGSTTFEWSDDSNGQPISNVQAMLILALQETVSTPTQVWAVANGNSNAGATWNGGVIPTSTQDVFANGFTVTVNTSTEWKSANTTAGTTAVAGGVFTLSNGVTLTLNNGSGTATAGSSTCITYGGTSGNSASIIGNVTGSATTGSSYGASNTSTGTLTVTGNATGGTIGASAFGLLNNGAGTVNLVGQPIAGVTSGAAGARNNGSGTLNITASFTGTATGPAAFWNSGGGTITGVVTGGTANSASAIQNGGSGTVTVVGSTIGGSAALAIGVLNSGSGTISITTDATGGSNATAYGASNTGTGTLTVAGKAISATAPGVNGAAGATLTSVGAAETGVNCIHPINGKVVFASLTAATYGIRNSAATLGTLQAGGSRPAAFEQQVIG